MIIQHSKSTLSHTSKAAMSVMPQKCCSRSFSEIYCHSQFNIYIKKLVHKFFHMVTSFHQVEEQNLWLKPSNRWLVYKDGILKVDKVSINGFGLVKVIINVVVKHHDLPNSMMSERELVFTSKILSLQCYFLDIKPRLLIII